MKPIRDVKVVWLSAGGMLLGACVSSGLPPLHDDMRQVLGADRDVVFDAAQAVLADEGYRIDRADPVEGIITTRPVPVTSRDEPLPSTVHLSSKRRIRRVVEVRIGESGEGFNVYCKVAVQQQVTETHRFLWRDSTTSDLPGKTAIDRGAAATTDQNTVWRTIRRDKAAQRRILEAILKRAAGP